MWQKNLWPWALLSAWLGLALPAAADWVVQTVAGNGAAGYSGDGGATVLAA